MPRVIIDTERCKGCDICVHVCPREVLSINKSALNKNGYNAAQVSAPEKCTACAICARMCPDCVIAVEK